MTVLVSGATGTTGGEVLRQLRGAAVPVRAMTRSQDSAIRLRAEGIEAVVADLGDSSSVAAAVDGVAAIYVANPASSQLAEHEANLARAGARAGVAHLVKLSVISCAADSPTTFGRLHFEAEQAVQESGIAWTMLRPNGFMQNTLAWAAQIPTGTVRGPVLDARWSIVDARTIAGVAVAILGAPAEHAGRAYSLTGPEASSPREQVEILEEILERPIEAEEVSIEQAQESMRAAGWPAVNVEWMGELLRHYAAGAAEAVSPDADRVSRRPPYSYRQFAEDHRALWQGG